MCNVNFDFCENYSSPVKNIPVFQKLVTSLKSKLVRTRGTVQDTVRFNSASKLSYYCFIKYTVVQDTQSKNVKFRSC